MEIKHQRKKRSKRFLHKKEKSELRQNEDVNLHVKSHGNGSLREEEDGQADHNGEHVNQVGEEQDRQAEPNGELVNQVDNHQIRESIDGKQQAEHSVPCVNDNLLCREEDATAFGGAVGVLTEEKQGGGKIDEECPSVKGLEGQQNQIPAGGDCDYDNSCFRDRETILVSWRPAEVGIQQDDLQQVTDPHQEPACEPNNDVLETSEDENDKAVVSNYSIRFRNQEKR
ncbi:hypothetical protein L1049_008329 [Liquidambar formosana]|uniref:Uncharacterized protein n=1 Tax=Liquidambar formosana TaxID=63359 RepID=A0AAP0S3D3_LIQFO